ncbi:transposase, partial [Pseudomonas avellanae]
YRVKRKIEYAKAQLRAKVEHHFQVIKVRFNHRKVRYRGLEKNTAQLFSLLYPRHKPHLAKNEDWV